jgi:hypothetical protein
LIYARKDGNIVSIDEVQSGKDCGCVCPACGNKLWARKGEQRMHHFAHEPHTHCEYGYESSLHLAAKDILSRAKKMVIPPVYVEFPQSGKPKELLYPEKKIDIDYVKLENRFDDIIPDIVVDSGDEHFFIEIYVTHPIDDEKLKKLKEKKISTIEIDLSKEKRDISVEELSDILLKTSPQKSWKYNAVSEKWYQQFEKASDKMPLTQRGLALHVDGCPIGIRNWKGKNYANFVDDCTGCEYCFSYAHEGYILCSGRERIATKKDFLISKEERISNSNSLPPKFQDCPICKVQLVREKKDKGDVWQCPCCTFYIPVGFNLDEN